jgi:hypothetical protein
MRIRAGHLAGTAALALVLALAAGCRAVRSGASAPREPLRIGTVADAPPLVFRHKAAAGAASRPTWAEPSPTASACAPSLSPCPPTSLCPAC